MDPWEKEKQVFIDTIHIFFCAWHHIHLLRLFSVLSTGCMFSRAWHRLYVFPRLAPVTFFPALCIGCIRPYCYKNPENGLKIFPEFLQKCSKNLRLHL